MSATLAPKFVVIDDFLPDDVLASLDDHARRDPHALKLMELGGAPEQGHYSALRKLWVHGDGLGPSEPPFRSAVLARFAELCTGTGVPPFDVARVETEVCAQRPGSYFAKHIDTDTREPSRSLSSDRLISWSFISRASRSPSRVASSSFMTSPARYPPRESRRAETGLSLSPASSATR